MNHSKFNDILANTPGSFKSKLERIRRYLLLGKASVMVGAGFSRNADVPSHIEVKQWDGVGKDIYCRLNAVGKADDSKLVFKTPMRLASQFAAVFGRNELDNLIKDAIPDDSLNPGALHKQLLELPWRDVFTTNYDTLLERARVGLRHTYSVVTSKEMLLYKTSPRIVKLHGSFPDKTPFLMTEEDYRTYPQKYPEFVNTVRQALVESIFCLIGFSGDDPNFTSWQAWLRDVMGDYAGPSYLVTCDKAYDDSFKTLMKTRGIEVINFVEIGITDHKTALDFFFTYLSQREPEWTGRVRYDVHDVNLQELLPQLKSVRTAYPGWFILPFKYYGYFEDMYTKFPALEKAISNLESEIKEQILVELDWRADISLTFKDFDWYRTSLEECINRYGDMPLSPNAITLGISLLRLYRHHLDKKDDSSVLFERLSREKYRMTSLQLSKFYYTAAGNALSLLEYGKVYDLLKEWMPTASDYSGVIYKALIIAETKSASEARELLSEAYERVTSSLIQNTSQEELSIRAIIENLLAFYSMKRMPDNDSRFSFTDAQDSILRKVNEESVKPFAVRHNFAIGSENRSWHHGSGTNEDILYPYRYLLLCETYGFPYGFAENAINEKILAPLVPKMASFGIGYSLGPVLRCGHRDVVVSFASRSTLNFLSRSQADALAIKLLDSSTQEIGGPAWIHRNSEVLLPFLSRLSACCSPEIVRSIFKFAHQTYLHTRFPKAEDINIIYNNAMPDCIQDIYATVFTTDIYEDFRGNDIPYPDDLYEYYTPGNQEFEIIKKGFASAEQSTREFAFRRARLMLNANITVEQKQSIEEMIRSWRSKESTSWLVRYSYSVVEPTIEEKATVKKMANTDLKTFLDSDFKFNKSSESISSFSSFLSNLSCLVAYLSKDKLKAMVEKITSTIEDNKSVYMRDDSNDTFGGLRHFTRGLFSHIGGLVYQISLTSYSDKASLKALFNVLMDYLPSGLPVRNTMDRLNTIVGAISKDKMRNIITASIISDNEPVVIDSCNALVSHASHNQNVQKALQDIIFYSMHSDSDDIRMYLQTLKLIPLERMTSATKKMLAQMLISVLERVEGFGIEEERKTDIMHAGVNLARSVKDKTSDKYLIEAIDRWGEYAQREDVYNDIKRGWFE